jgi:SPP1 family predicted phage head-tail adaptor
MPELCARDFSEYVEVETPTESADGFGGYTDAWANKAYLWCKVDDTGGSESLTNGRLETDTSAVFVTQFRSDISTLDRLILDGVTFNIRRVENVERKSRYLRLYGESGVTT